LRFNGEKQTTSRVWSMGDGLPITRYSSLLVPRRDVDALFVDDTVTDPAAQTLWIIVTHSRSLG
jgi:hypothetical protein